LPRRPPVNERSLTWITVVAPLVFIVLVAWFHTAVVWPSLGDWGWAVSLAVVVTGTVLFSRAILSLLDRIYQEKQNLEEAVAIMTERERIAREMHDGFAQKLGYLNLKLGAAEEALRRGDGTALDEIKDMERVVQETYSDVRYVLYDLRSQVHPGESVLGAIRRYVADFRRQTGIPVSMHVSGDPDRVRLSPVAEVHLFRIVQEALTNVRKHAAASEVSVRVEVRPKEGITLSVRDDGRGFDLDAVQANGRSRFGLGIMQERAREVGGRLAVESRAGEGTTVRVWVPAEPVEAPASPAGT